MSATEIWQMCVTFYHALKEKRELAREIWKECWKYIIEHRHEIVKLTYDPTPLIKKVKEMLSNAGIKASFEEARFVAREITAMSPSFRKIFEEWETLPLVVIECPFASCSEDAVILEEKDGRWEGRCSRCGRVFRLEHVSN